ncbi:MULTISPECIES: ribosomal protein S18-alanine N-acetyltransferase [Paenibacillus]|uniref:Ribosomal protein S18-alanine N-acetyltransferase n=1 Tax=Paenibacillus lignilyticus TaxID=1172615 RepID=A0ABS5CID1_9BACL|nr:MULTISPECIES: ribosomal protein S18-alanine N-acetyltransferase [Paenibacillus]MBP3965629.1 ribosomal protein S18-alanine N-acetyltransferase [Paenibacillus lignilyticus]SFT15640.1 [SSU ribosomal protein S18P]-alanine acetyltransferase [Paenibacillus sp. BC26]
MTVIDVNRLVFRLMTMSDVKTIVAIEQESFTSPWTEEAFVNELTNNHFARYMVMDYEGEVIGYGGMWTIMDEAHVTNVAVREQYRGRGLGEMLMVELQRAAVMFGAKRMTLEVRVSNEVAQRLYRKLGFEPSGVRPGYYSDNKEDALIMWAELDASGEVENMYDDYK